MKGLLKFGIVLSLLKGTFLFANSNLYQDYLSLINEDVKALNKIFLNDLEKANNSDAELELVVDIIKNLDNQVNSLTKNLNSSISKVEVEGMLNLISELSNKNYELAKIILFLANHQADNANESYKHTLDELIYATLRLSDDIGIMADRILLMAQQIGIMADRILETQRIQSKNYNNTINLLSSLK